MNIVEKLLDAIKIRSGEKSQEIFFNRFLHSKYQAQLSKPLLKKSSKEFKYVKNCGDLPCTSLSSLKIENTSHLHKKIVLNENFTDKLYDLEAAFNLFVNLSSHSNPLGDFRKYSDIYHHLYCTSRYVFFHGDGNCVTLGILFYSLLENFYKKDAIQLHYCCGLQREFMHVYAFSKGKEKYYIDPDQKIFCPDDQLNATYSPGLIYQLLSGAGFHVYDSIPKHKRDPLFYTMTHEIMDEYRVLPGPIIYQKDPHKANFSYLFEKARSDNSEKLDVYTNDYKWKVDYSELSKKYYNDLLPFLVNLKQEVEISVPPKGTIYVGLNHDFPKEVYDLCLIFFGRVPLIIEWTLAEQQEYAIPLPDMPWMIYVDPQVEYLYVNHIKVDLHLSICGKYRYAGMGDIEKIINLSDKIINLSLRSENESIVRIILPFNALAFNADLIRMKAEDNECKISYTSTL